ncbi:hypothetical protein QZH41_011662, partial [Actinostola sp. cb2023]
QYTYGNTGKLLVEACIIGLSAGTLCAFNVIIGDLGPSIIHNLFAVEITRSLRATVMIVLAYGIGLPVSLMRDISSLASLSALSLFFYTAFVTQVIFKSLPHLFAGEWLSKINMWRPAGLLQSLPIFSLAFAGQTIVLSLSCRQLFGLYDSIPEPSVKKMESVVNMGLNIVSCVYISVGFFSYITFFEVGVQGDILTNYVNSFLAECLKLGFVMSVIVSFPLMVFPMRASINSLLFPSQTAGTENMPGGPGYMPQNRFVYITVSIISLTLIVGILIPQIEFVLGLTGATMGIIITMILPASMFLHAVQETQGRDRNTAKFALVVGFVLLIASTYTVLTSSESHHENDKPLHVHPDIKPSLERIQIGNKPSLKPTHNLTGLVMPVQSAPTGAINLGKADPKEIKDDDKGIKEKGLELEEKRKEPALPHPPDDKIDELAKQKDAAGNVVKGKKELIIDDKGAKGIDKAEKGADPLNEKRQLMSTDDAKGKEPQKSALKVASSFEVEKRAKVNHSNNLVNKSLKKPESREKRHLDENPNEKKDAKKSGNGMGNDESGTGTPITTPNKSNIAPKASTERNSVVVIQPTTSSGAYTQIKSIEASSVDPHPSNDSGVKSRELKSNDVIGRKLNSVNPYNSIWRKRLRKQGSLRVKRHSKVT